jgi:hypothetical protein
VPMTRVAYADAVCVQCRDPASPVAVGSALCDVCAYLRSTGSTGHGSSHASPPENREGVFFDPGAPSPLHFRGQGSRSVPVIDQIFAIGRRVVVDVLPMPPPPAPASTELVA